QRSAYLQSIGKFIGNRLVKVIVGQRRSGKSYLMRQIIHFLIDHHQTNPENIFFLNKEYIAFDSIKNASDLDSLFKYYLSELNVSGKCYIFLDEVQNIENWEKFVNSYAQDYTGEFELFVTGSNSNLLSGELATLLSGRYVQFELMPFNLEEFARFKQAPINKETFLEYLQQGGLPEMLRLNDEEMQRHYISDLKNTIILRDVVQRNRVNDLALLEDVFKYLSVNIGNLTSLQNIVKYFKSKQKQANYETLSKYVGFLLDTFVVHEVERFNLKGKQVLGGVRKYYLNDLAFKNLVFGYQPEDIGYHLENYVYLYFRQLGFETTVGILNGKEVDFVARKSDRIIYIQVAYLLADRQTIEREFGNLLAIKDNHPKVVISLDDIAMTGYEGIYHFRPWELDQVLKNL
ncbi:MAG: ATP-binding protein, partial [Bacteroidota bacterium]